MAELPSTTKNDLTFVYKKFINTQPTDITFIFKVEGHDDVTLTAHKDILASVSVVFDALICSSANEKGEVEIVGTSAAAFQEFLQFFYKDELNLTMEHIDEVLYLLKMYHITEFFGTAIKFLKQNLTSDNLVWGLELAKKYESNDLKAYLNTFF